MVLDSLTTMPSNHDRDRHTVLIITKIQSATAMSNARISYVTPTDVVMAEKYRLMLNILLDCCVDYNVK